jgi:hypothetical protein
MADTQPVNVIRIEAIFQASKDGIHVLSLPDEIKTQRGINQIVISLATEPPAVAPATFAATPPGPVCWLDAGGQVIPTPPGFQVVRQDHELTVWVLNGTSYTTLHAFWLTVQFEGKFYFKDPTIINQKPG